MYSEGSTGQSYAFLYVADRLVNGSQQLVALLLGECLVHPAGHRESGMNAPPTQDADDLLAVFAQLDRLQGQLGIGLDDAYHIADGRVSVETKNQVGASQVEEVHGM